MKRRRRAPPGPTQELKPLYVVGSDDAILAEHKDEILAEHKDEILERHKDEILEQHKDEILEQHKDEIVEKQRELDRKAGAKKRHEDAQFTDKDRAAIDEFLDGPHSKKSSHWIAGQIQSDPAKVVTYPKKKKLVPYAVSQLARKITDYRRQK